MILCQQQLHKKAPLLCKKWGKLKDATPLVPRTDESTVAVHVVPVILPFPAISPTPPTIPIATIIDDTPAISKNVSIVKNAIIDNLSISNECDNKGEIGEVDDFDSLDIDFYNKSKTNIAKNDTFFPSTKKLKTTDTDDTTLK